MARKNTTTKADALGSRLAKAREAVDALHDRLETAEESFAEAAATGTEAQLAAAQRARDEAEHACERAEAVALAIAAEMPKAQKHDAQTLATETERQLARLAADGEAASARIAEGLATADAAVSDLLEAIDAARTARIACAAKVGALARTPAGGASVSPELLAAARRIVERLLGGEQVVIQTSMSVHTSEKRARPVAPHPSYDTRGAA